MTKQVSVSFNSDERGQLILVGGVLIASLLIILVLVLNGVLYTENIATREQPQAIDRGVDMASVVEGTVDDLIKFENEEKYESEGTAADNLQDDLSNANALFNDRQFNSHGELTSIEPESIQNAWIVTQEQPNEFTSVDRGFTGPHAQWTLATGDGIRNGEMTVTSASTIDPNADGSDPPQRNDVFQLVVRGDDGGVWSIWVFEHPSQDAIVITDTIDGDGHPVIDPSVACISDSVPAEIDFTDMTIDGNNCDFEFAESVSDGPYELEFRQGDEIEGTYEFTIGKDATDPDVGLGEFNVAGVGFFDYVYNTMDGDNPEPDQPTAYDGVYSATIQLVIDGQDVHLDTTVYGAPSQPEQTKSGEEQ